VMWRARARVLGVLFVSFKVLASGGDIFGK